MRNIKRVREIFANLKANEAVWDESDYYFLWEFFKEHPKWEEKSKGGFDYFFKAKNEWGFSFAVMRVDKTFDFISMNFPKEISKKSEVLQAFRNHIQSQIDAVRNKINYGVDRCELSNIVLTKTNTHIDHYNPDFRFVVLNYMNQKNVTFDELHKYIYKKNVKHYFNDAELIADWQDYHSKNTSLRAITADENLRRSKK